ncbi:hypothetical protein Misp02_37440 [Microtetraspora sp. NBRC 16547]|nr:hypothetical protein Misp02_37440 [Microtetraspora sp. NBRC 16547]
MVDPRETRQAIAAEALQSAASGRARALAALESATSLVRTAVLAGHRQARPSGLEGRRAGECSRRTTSHAKEPGWALGLAVSSEVVSVVV